MTKGELEEEFWWDIRKYEQGEKTKEELLDLLFDVYERGYEMGIADGVDD